MIRPIPAERHEWPALAGSFAYFFCLLAGYYILRPVRDTMGVAIGSRDLPALFTAMFVAMLVLVPLFGWLCARLPRARIAPVFFVWVGVYNLFVVSVFWSFMADLWSSAQAERLYGAIAAGGSLGRWAKAHPRPADPDPEQPMGGSVLAGARTALASPYLLGVCAWLLCYTLLSTTLYFQQIEIVGREIAEAAERTRLFSTVDLVVNSLTLLTQVLLFPRLVAGLGVTWLLALMPLLSVAGFLVLGAAPMLAVLIVFGVARRAGEFAISKPVRETLFTVVPREDKYKAKNFIDTVIYRGGDTTAGWVFSGLRTLGLSLPAISFAMVPVAVAWAAVSLYLGRQHAKLKAGGG